MVLCMTITLKCMMPSILLDIPYFSMFKGELASDIMHDVLEGVAPLEMSLVLQHCLRSIYPLMTTIIDLHTLILSILKLVNLLQLAHGRLLLMEAHLNYLLLNLFL